MCEDEENAAYLFYFTVVLVREINRRCYEHARDVLFLSPRWQRWNEFEFLSSLPGHVRRLFGETCYGFCASGRLAVISHGAEDTLLVTCP